MANIEFMHVGMTVSDLDLIINFYSKYLGFREVRRGKFDENFIGGSPELYRQPPGTYSLSAFLESDFGVTLELFQFSNVEKSPTWEWNMTGYHHLAFKVDSIPALYKQMQEEDGIEFFFEPKPRGPADANVHWIFFKDPDGNTIELWD